LRRGCYSSIAEFSSSVDVRAWTQCSGWVRAPRVGLCQCESGSGASLDACAMSVARCQSSGVGRLSDAWRRTPATDPGPSFDGLSDRVMWSCEGLAAPVIGGEGSEALCERLIGSRGSTMAASRRGEARFETIL